jgi:hypothetical protein
MNNAIPIPTTNQIGSHPKPTNINIETNTIKNIKSLETPSIAKPIAKKLTKAIDIISFPNSVFNGPKKVSNNSTIVI